MPSVPSQVRFFIEFMSAGFDVLCADLDVVWLIDHWQRWMTWADPKLRPVAEASLIALDDANDRVKLHVERAAPSDALQLACEAWCVILGVDGPVHSYSAALALAALVSSVLCPAVFHHGRHACGAY